MFLPLHYWTLDLITSLVLTKDYYDGLLYDPEWEANLFL